MKKLLTIISLCFLSTFTFANFDLSSDYRNFYVDDSMKKIDGVETFTNQILSYDEEVASCTATFVILVTAPDGTVIDSFSATYTVTLDDPMFICTAAMSIAQSMAWDKYYTAQRTILEE